MSCTDTTSLLLRLTNELTKVARNPQLIILNPFAGGGEIFRTRTDRLWDPPSLLYNGYRVFPRGKAAEEWR